MSLIKLRVSKAKKDLVNESTNKKTHKKNKTDTFNLYLYRVLKVVQPDLGISKKAIVVMNNFMNDMFERIVSEASSLCKISKNRTLLARDIETAVRLLLPGELAHHAISEGTKAIVRYNGNK